MATSPTSGTLSPLERFHQFCCFESSFPAEGKMQNTTETIANAFLMPARVSIGFLILKEQGNFNLYHLIHKVIGVALFIISLPLTLIGVGLKYLGRILPHEVAPANTPPKYTDSRVIELCYELGSTFREVCDRTQILKTSEGKCKFVALSGTALGLERHIDSTTGHGGMIPWDDDIDLGILIQDEPEFLQLVEELKKVGIECNDTYRGLHGAYRLKFSEAKINELREKLGLTDIEYSHVPEMDITLWAQMKNGTYTSAAALNRALWPTEYMTQEEWDTGFQEYQFGPTPTEGKPLKLPCLPPEQRRTYLQRYYGNDCFTHGCKTHGHVEINLGIYKWRLMCAKPGGYRYKFTPEHKVPAQGSAKWKTPAVAQPSAVAS